MFSPRTPYDVTALSVHRPPPPHTHSYIFLLGQSGSERRGREMGIPRGNNPPPPPPEPGSAAHLDAVADVVQYIVVHGLPDVPDGPLHVSRRYDLMGPRGVLVGGQDADLPPGHLLFMDVHRL